MRQRTRAALAALVLVSVSGLAWAATGAKGIETGNREFAQAALERPKGSADLAAELAERAALHGWLVSEMVASGRATPIRVQVDASEIQNLGRDTDGSRVPMRVGLVGRAGQFVSLAGIAPSGLSRTPQPVSFGAIRQAVDGGYVYTTEITSPGAAAMRVHFEDFFIPKGSELYLFTMRGEVFGPYTQAGPHGDGEFWSHTLMGDTVLLQIRRFGPPVREDLEDTWFTIADVGHLGAQFVQAFGDAAGSSRSFCQYNASCIENAACGSSQAVETNAIAHMQWVSGAFLNICTGGLIADTDTGSTIPYFLTANHCINKGKDARNLENFFQLTASCGTSNCPDLFDTRNNHPQSLRTLGARVRATGSGGDYSLLELDEAAPAGSVYMGWTSAPVADSNDTNLHRLSHPDGAPQAYSAHRVDTSAGTCQGLPRGSWIYSRDTAGATDGGSSGAPVVNGSGQVVGQLTGACGTNPGNVCDANSNATIDGAFAAYFNSVSQYLDPGTSCNPSPEVCDDGSDNDCDDAIDCSDSDCAGDPACSGTCGGNGDTCSDNADCCSNKCRRGSCKGN